MVVQDRASVILIHQWQLWRAAEKARLDKLKKTMMKIYGLTSNAPMEGPSGKMETLERVHELVNEDLTAEEKLEQLGERRVNFAKMVGDMKERDRDWYWGDSMRTTREICEMMSK
jgi:hypothetical protein